MDSPGGHFRLCQHAEGLGVGTWNWPLKVDSPALPALSPPSQGGHTDGQRVWVWVEAIFFGAKRPKWFFFKKFPDMVVICGVSGVSLF